MLFNMYFVFLGFDPWNECSKGLADLLQEEEKKANPMLKTAYAQNYLSSFQRDVSHFTWQVQPLFNSYLNIISTLFSSDLFISLHLCKLHEKKFNMV